MPCRYCSSKNLVFKTFQHQQVKHHEWRQQRRLQQQQHHSQRTVGNSIYDINVRPVSKMDSIVWCILRSTYCLDVAKGKDKNILLAIVHSSKQLPTELDSMSVLTMLTSDSHRSGQSEVIVFFRAFYWTIVTCFYYFRHFKQHFKKHKTASWPQWDSNMDPQNRRRSFWL